MNLVDSIYVFEERAGSDELARKRAGARGRRIAELLMDADWARGEMEAAISREEVIKERGTEARKASADASLTRLKALHFARGLELAREMRRALNEAMSGWVVRDKAPMHTATNEEVRMLREMLGGAEE